MTPDETLELLYLIAGYHPGFVMNEHTPVAWHHALKDIPAEQATAAMHEHFAVAGPWITVADIRRRIADRLGLTPPDAEVAYMQAVRFKKWLNARVGDEPEIHPAALEAARTVGWTTFESLEGLAHKRFVTAYDTTFRAAQRELATTPFPVLLARVEEPKALPGGYGIREPKPPATNPKAVARLDRMIGEAMGSISVDGDDH